ncbi:hypothetical protein RRG08_058618 [Elysia crispata]|uniref:Uncharacterized protein n=1 Tax=Elysia crispata TaxID=231223 RepID=A0AAE1D8G2_9GAST|nr:hypothetical protein RRG08_058618 [Elysia crispata]
MELPQPGRQRALTLTSESARYLSNLKPGKSATDKYRPSLVFPHLPWSGGLHAVQVCLWPSSCHWRLLPALESQCLQEFESPAGGATRRLEMLSYHCGGLQTPASCVTAISLSWEFGSRQPSPCGCENLSVEHSRISLAQRRNNSTVTNSEAPSPAPEQQYCNQEVRRLALRRNNSTVTKSETPSPAPEQQYCNQDVRRLAQRRNNSTVTKCEAPSPAPEQQYCNQE